MRLVFAVGASERVGGEGADYCVINVAAEGH